MSGRVNGDSHDFVAPLTPHVLAGGRRQERQRFTPARPAGVSRRCCLRKGCTRLDRRQSPHDVLARAWPDDHPSALVLRAATSPAATSDAENAALQVISKQFLAALLPVSAGAALLSRGLTLTFGQDAAISLPTIAASASAGGFVGESKATVRKMPTAAGPTLSPYKFGTIAERMT